MSTSAGSLNNRRPTRQIMVGKVPVGGGAPITVQSMTITKTADVEGTLQQIYALAAAGCDIVRCTCNEIEAAEGLAQIVPRSPVPIIADIHHQYKMALAAMEAGVHGLRLNPGNIRRPEHIKAVASEAKDRGIPIRIGVNGGSLDPELYDKYGGKVTPEAMVESAMREIAYFDEVGFDQIKISVKASNVPLMVEAYRQLSEVTDHPLHLGVTEAGPLPNGLLKATAGIAALLLEGIGDTIRYSLTADPVEEARAGRQLLESLGLRERKNVDLIACPSCGRAEIDVIDVARRAQEAFADKLIPLQVAVMGCVVNGPGEARDGAVVHDFADHLVAPARAPVTAEVAFKVNGKAMLFWNPTHDCPVFKVPFEERDHLIEMDPDTFFTTDHHRPHRLVLARPDRLDIEWARENLTRVWRAQAKKAVVKAWDVER